MTKRRSEVREQAHPSKKKREEREREKREREKKREGRKGGGVR